MRSRRDILRLGGGVAGALGLSRAGFPRLARAESSLPGEDLKFLFVMMYGGWDPTRVFAPEFDNPLVDMEPDAVPATIGGLNIVDHIWRPSVRSFLERQHSRSVILNGLSLPSVGHVECLRFSMTGDTTGTSPDWAALLAAGQRDRYGLPHVIVSGPEFPGEYGSLVARVGTNGQTVKLLSGELLATSDLATSLPTISAQSQVDAWLAKRAKTLGKSARSPIHKSLIQNWEDVLVRSHTLETLADTVAWNCGSTLSTQIELAVDLFRLDVARCVTLTPFIFEDIDSHADNDERQTRDFEELFAGLNSLMDRLEATPGVKAPTLADEVVIVCMSEMGRTPQLNGGLGKDHWGTTSVFMCGPNLTGDRTVGSFGEYYGGEPIDFATGEISASGRRPAGGDFGATLLALGGIDPGDALPNHAPIEGMLAG